LVQEKYREEKARHKKQQQRGQQQQQQQQHNNNNNNNNNKGKLIEKGATETKQGLLQSKPRIKQR
jgi:hypothetical protein